ncbi:MAG: PDZ domain-containing protein, partial [Gemmatimonadaceae bacterium]|nr:PDZ domain-containing protein [Gemmatimonadaceae bacterium]
MPTRLLSATLLALVGAASTLPAQVRTTRPEPDEVRQLARTLISRIGDDADRPRLGITVEARGVSDTLGLLVGDVTADGPADKAGVKAGDRLLAINA